MKTLKKGDFPRRLAEITDPPEKLYLRGEIPKTKKYLAVVGSRKFTSYGKQVTKKLMSGLAGADLTIVSGLALGTDANAHKAALKANLPCLAVPGSGLDDSVLYPKTNQPLAKNILKAGGGLLSEFAPEFSAKPWSFPKRNRIMAGLAHAVLIIEATEKSGTLITARLAREYNRDVLAVPGQINSANAAGANDLIKDGAGLIQSAEDILHALDLKINDSTKDKENLSDDQNKIIDALAEPRTKDELIAAVDLPANSVNILLSQLELAGQITESGGTFQVN